MAFWDKEQLIVSVEKNKSENIDVKSCERNGKKYIDVRVSKVDKEGTYHPTSSGVAIPVDKWEEITQSVRNFMLEPEAPAEV